MNKWKPRLMLLFLAFIGGGAVGAVGFYFWAVNAWSSSHSSESTQRWIEELSAADLRSIMMKAFIIGGFAGAGLLFAAFLRNDMGDDSFE